MVLSEGKGVGAGKQSSMPGSELARANSILQPFPLLPLQTNKRIHSILGPGPVYTFPLGDGKHHSPLVSPHPLPLPQAPGLWPGPPGIALAGN